MKKKRMLAALSIFATVLVVALATDTRGFTGGRPGDATIDYGYSESCHNFLGTATITASASTLSPSAGQSISVKITVTSTQLGSSKKIGVFLLRSLQPTNSLPTQDGWTILSDPNGGTNNYVEKVAAGPGIPVDFVWSLKAPSTPGTYRLYARAQHGGGSAYYENFKAGLTFNVLEAVAGVPYISHEPPKDVRPDLQIEINATILNATSAKLLWKNATMGDFETVDMTNTSFRVGKGWLYAAVIPAQGAPTTLEYIINATKDGLYGVATFSLVVEEAKPSGIPWSLQVQWILSIVAVVVMATSIAVLLNVIIRRQLRG